eukprot:scaffold4501_cov118-Cylindrotheca_fusiformis.AAC.5
MASSTILQKASAWRNKYIGKVTKDDSAITRTAVVVGATSGIGQAISHRLAEQGWKIVAVGRDRPGRAEEIVQSLTKSSPSTTIEHSFVPCDCFSLQNVQTCATNIQNKDEDGIDALVLTQGMATAQGFTPTKEGNDQKLTLHYFSRMAFASLLLPSLAKSKSDRMPNGPVVLSVLSGGIHGPYKYYQDDFSLSNHYSIKNAADAAGYYTDLGFDALARDHPNVNFVHASPGVVNTNWGTEFNPILRTVVRCMQPLMGKKASDCAEFMVGPTILASSYGDELPPKKSYNDNNNDDSKGVIVMGEKGQSVNLTKNHTKEAVEFVWNQTVETLKKAGVDI